MITIADLEAAGYRSYKSHKAEGLWSKWIESEGRRLFSIHYYLWKYPPHANVPDQFSAEVRMYQDPQRGPALTHENETSFDLNLMVGDVSTVEGVEAFYRRAYLALNCIPDPHNQS